MSNSIAQLQQQATLLLGQGRIKEAIAAHLQIGITACNLLRKEGNKLHSRKLRAFNEPPFR